jgi:predicted small secreted protein
VKDQKLELAVSVFALAVIVALLGACSTVEGAGGSVTEFVACPIDVIDCGHVYLCEQAADNELGHVETCVDDDTDGQLEAAEHAYGACVPTPRHEGLCRYHCDGGQGCNAYNGCFCPK